MNAFVRARSAVFGLLSILAACESDVPSEPRLRDLSHTRSHQDRLRIEWPDDLSRRLQDVIDAAPAGATIEIGAGDYSIGPLVVRKDLTLAGAGSGRNSEGLTTRLLGRTPRPVVDESGEVIVRAAEVEPYIAAYGIDFEIRDLVLQGFDAAILATVDEAGRGGSTIVRDVVIDGSGRGIVAIGPGTLTVQDTDIHASVWHGISVSGGLDQLLLQDVNLFGPGCAGVYVEDVEQSVVTANVSVLGALCGGILVVRTSGFILDSVLLGNHYAGIAVFQAPVFLIRDNLIQSTQALGTSGLGGDAIALFLSPDVDLESNVTFQSARAGVAAYGSDVTIGDNTLLCSAFDIDNEIWDGVPTTFDDEGGNECGCGATLGDCEAVSSQILPTPPVNDP